MISSLIGILLGVIAGLAYLLYKARKEVAYRDRHLAWVDDRDVLLADLFARVSEARVVPMTNPLAGMKQHGMITKNAVTPAYLAEMDERLTYAQGFLKRAITAAKEVERWEAQNPPPPVRPGEEREANVAKPMPMPDHAVGDPHGDRTPVFNTSPLPASFAGPKSLGKGAFGPEQGDEEYDPEADVDPTHMEDHYNGDGYSDETKQQFEFEMPKRPVRDNPQA